MSRKLTVFFYALIVLPCALCETIMKMVKQGDDAEIHCSHQFAHGNIKYFCVHPCKETEHVLINSKAGSLLPDKKYYLQDQGNGEFTVTIFKVQPSDSGTYYCGVDRLLADTYKEVQLEVITDDIYGDLMVPDEKKSNDLVYIGAGLAAMFLGLSLSLLLLVMQKKRAKLLALSAQGTSNNDSDQQQVSNIYENTMQSSNQKAYSADSNQFSINQEEDFLPYTSVQFLEPPADGRKRALHPASVIYSTVKM